MVFWIAVAVGVAIIVGMYAYNQYTSQQAAEPKLLNITGTLTWRTSGLEAQEVYVYTANGDGEVDLYRFSVSGSDGTYSFSFYPNGWNERYGLWFLHSQGWLAELSHARVPYGGSAVINVHLPTPTELEDGPLLYRRVSGRLELQNRILPSKEMYRGRIRVSGPSSYSLVSLEAPTGQVVGLVGDLLIELRRLEGLDLEVYGEWRSLGTLDVQYYVVLEWPPEGRRVGQLEAKNAAWVTGSDTPTHLSQGVIHLRDAYASTRLTSVPNELIATIKQDNNRGAKVLMHGQWQGASWAPTSHIVLRTREEGA